jgi:ribosomal-protein-alanine N-acetyltransferase
VTAISGAIEIDQLDPADAARCAELEELLFPGDGPWSADAFRAELQQPSNRYFAARAFGELVGYAGIAMLGAPGNGESEIHTIGVDPAWHRRGVGRRLMDSMLAVSDRFGGPVFLEVRTDNDAAIAMYQAYGFTIMGTRRRYYEPSGADAYTMCRQPASAVAEATQ